MARNTLNLAELLNRLGVKGAEGTYELIEALQPVLTVGALDGLIQPLLPPMAWIGGAAIATVGQRAAFRVRGGSRGGVYLSRIAVNSPLANSGFQIDIRTGPAAFSGPLANACLPVQMTPTLAGLSQVSASVGNRVTQLAGLVLPLFATAATVPTVIVEGMFLEPGQVLYVQGVQDNVSANFAALAIDCPSAWGAE